MTAAKPRSSGPPPGSDGAAVNDESQQPPATGAGRTFWIVVFALVAAVGSAAPWGTIGRLTVMLTFPLAVLALVRHHVGRGPGAATMATATMFWLVALPHIVFTSPTAAWAVDSHIVPWMPIPGSTTRITLAWATPLCWTALVSLAAWRIHRASPHCGVTGLLTITAILPLLNPNGFPVDGYHLLWNRSTFAHPTYTTATLAFTAATLLENRPGKQANATAPPDAEVRR